MIRSEGDPKVSVIIPSWDGHRDGCVPRLMASIASQTFQDFEIHVVKGVSPQGRAINQGVRAAKGSIVIILDDDSLLADEQVFERLVASIESDPTIGMSGASIVLSSDATAFQRRAAREFPRFNTPVVSTTTDSDLACHGCCALPKAVFDEVGGEREDLVRGLDPDLRVRLRAAGYRVVLAPETRIHHPLPDGIAPLLRTFFRNGVGSAYAQKFQPDSVYDTHEDLAVEQFKPRRPFAYRAARFPLRVVRAMFTGKWLRMSAYCAYACGYIWGYTWTREMGVSMTESEVS